MISAPGTEAGPCKDSCAHTDCFEAFKDANRRCAICTDAIGFATPYYCDGPRWTHRACRIAEAFGLAKAAST